jgi:hypothetical protein
MTNCLQIARREENIGVAIPFTLLANASCFVSSAVNKRKTSSGMITGGKTLAIMLYPS